MKKMKNIKKVNNKIKMKKINDKIKMNKKKIDKKNKVKKFINVKSKKKIEKYEATKKEYKDYICKLEKKSFFVPLFFIETLIFLEKILGKRKEEFENNKDFNLELDKTKLNFFKKSRTSLIFDIINNKDFFVKRKKENENIKKVFFSKKEKSLIIKAEKKEKRKKKYLIEKNFYDLTFLFSRKPFYFSEVFKFLKNKSEKKRYTRLKFLNFLKNAFNELFNSLSFRKNILNLKEYKLNRFKITRKNLQNVKCNFNIFIIDEMLGFFYEKKPFKVRVFKKDFFKKSWHIRRSKKSTRQVIQ